MSGSNAKDDDILSIIDSENGDKSSDIFSDVADENDVVLTEEDNSISTADTVETNIVFSAEEGDIFINKLTVPTMIILTTTEMANGDVFYRVRFPLVADYPVSITAKEAGEFVTKNELTKFVMYRDTMRDVTDKIILNNGDVFTQDGKTIAVILTDVFVYSDRNGKATSVVGCSIGGNVGTYRDVFELKVFLFESADEFAELRNPSVEE